MSLWVITLASFLPTVAYSARQVIDRTVGPWMAVGGALGGFGGGWLLGHLGYGTTAPLIVFGLAAMFLCAQRLVSAHTV
jgi:uncharacterized membrane protein YfcA